MNDLEREIRSIVSRDRPLYDSDLNRLAVLRHELGKRCVDVPCREACVTKPAQPFTENCLVPEVQCVELTAEHIRSALQSRGFLIVRNAVSSRNARNLVESLGDERWEGPPVVPVDAQGREVDGAAPMMCNPERLQLLIEAYLESGLDTVLSNYMGERPVLLAERMLVNRKKMVRGLPWHQDGAFFGANVGAINSFLALESTGIESTGLTLVAKHFTKLAGLAEGERGELGYGNSLKHEEVLEQFGEGLIVTPELQPGDAIFLDEMTLHRTSFPVDDAEPRAWSITWFFPPSRFPSDKHPIWFG